MKAAMLWPAEMIISKSLNLAECSQSAPYKTHSSVLLCLWLVRSPSFSHNLTQFCSRIDPAQEIARLRHSISLLEAYVFPSQRSQPPPHRRQSDASSLIPKKEIIDPDVTDKPSAAPGMLGSQGQGGLYTGATSTTTHLLMVITFVSAFPDCMLSDTSSGRMNHVVLRTRTVARRARSMQRNSLR
jgi:hypothetical protein